MDKEENPISEDFPGLPSDISKMYQLKGQINKETFEKYIAGEQIGEPLNTVIKDLLVELGLKKTDDVKMLKEFILGNFLEQVFDNKNIVAVKMLADKSDCFLDADTSEVINLKAKIKSFKS